MLEFSSDCLPEEKMLHIVFSNLDKISYGGFKPQLYMNFAFSCNKSTCTPVTHQRQAHMNMQWIMHTHSKHKLTFALHLNPNSPIHMETMHPFCFSTLWQNCLQPQPTKHNYLPQFLHELKIVNNNNGCANKGSIKWSLNSKVQKWLVSKH
jgi:hypothetical protein